MLQDLLISHENAEELVRKEFAKGQMEDFILLINGPIIKNILDTDQGSKFRTRMMNFAANILDKKFDNETDFLSFINIVLKELNNEKKIDSWEIAVMSFIFGAVTSLQWNKNFRNQNEKI